MSDTSSLKDLRDKLLKLPEEDLLTMAENVKQVEELDKREAAKLYVPNGKAEKFIALVGQDKTFVNMFVGANGTSKTATGTNILVNICYGVQNKFFDHPIFRKWPYLKRGRIISDPTTIKEKIIPELRKWMPYNDAKKLPDALYDEAKQGKSYTQKIITNTGWEIDLMTTEQDVKEFESVDLGFVWIDEPIPQDRFMATLSRGRLGMVVFWTYTPLFKAAWIKQWIDDHADGEYADYVEAEMEDNCKVHGERGILEHAHIKRMVDGMPEDEKEARAFGKFGHLVGRVHKKFSRKVHVIKPFKIDPRLYTTYVALDPHPRVADHALYLSVDKNGTKYFTSEIVHEGDIQALWQRMIKHEEERGYRMDGQRIIDPSAFNDDQHRKEPTVGKQLEDVSHWSLTRGAKDVIGGIKRTDTALDYEIVQGRMVRPPEIFVFESCPVFIKQLEGYVWSEWKGNSRDEKQPRPVPRDKDDHQVENAHRLLLAEPTFVHMQFTRPGGSNNINIEEEQRELDPYY